MCALTHGRDTNNALRESKGRREKEREETRRKSLNSLRYYNPLIHLLFLLLQFYWYVTQPGILFGNDEIIQLLLQKSENEYENNDT